MYQELQYVQIPMNSSSCEIVQIVYILQGWDGTLLSLSGVQFPWLQLDLSWQDFPGENHLFSLESAILCQPQQNRPLWPANRDKIIVSNRFATAICCCGNSKYYRNIGVHVAGVVATRPILHWVCCSLAVSCWVLAISSQDCTRNDLRRWIFLGGHALDPPSWHALQAYVLY